MGLSETNDTSEPIETLEKMRWFRTMQKTSNDSASCNPGEFGGVDPWPGKDKQCFCEVAPVPKPQKCGEENANCLCKGTVVFGRKFGEDGHELNFEEMTLGEVSIKKVNNSMNVTCSSQSLGDPTPGHQKQCFCDEHNDFFDEEEIKEIEEFEEARKEEEDSKAQEIKAQLELEAAEKEAAEKAAKAAEEAKKQAAELEALRLKAAAEAEAAKKKAEAEAAAEEAKVAAEKAAAEAKAKAKKEEAAR